MQFKQILVKSMLVLGLGLLMFNASTASVIATAKSESIQVHKFNFTFTVDNQRYEAPLDQQGFIYQNRTYVPLRFASYMLEKWVDWDKTKKAVVVSEPTENQLQQLKQKKGAFLTSSEVEQSVPKAEKLVLPVYSNYGSLIVYGKEQEIPLDVTTILHDGTIYVPLRFFGEVLRHSVDFDEQTKKISISTSQQLSKNEPHQEEANTEEVTEKEQIVTTPGIANPGGGSGASVSRESIIESTETELNRLKAIYMAKATDLGKEYQATTDEEIRGALMAEGFLVLNEADIKVSELLANLDQTLIANGYTVGTDSKTFNDLYIEQKDGLIGAFLSNQK